MAQPRRSDRERIQASLNVATAVEIPIVYVGEAKTMDPMVKGIVYRFVRGVPHYIPISVANLLLNRGNFKHVTEVDARLYQDPQKWVDSILVARTLHSLGDMLYATVTPRALKKKYPRSNVTVAVPRQSFPIWFHNPWVNNLIPWEGTFGGGNRRFELFFDITRPCVQYEITHHPSHKSRIDIYMEHCGATLPDEEKKPIYTITDEERAKAAEMAGGKHFLAIQLRANSPDRNWQPTPQGAPVRQDNNKALIKAWLDRHPDHHILVIDQHDDWVRSLDLPNDHLHTMAGKDIRTMMAMLNRCFMALTLNSGLLVAAGAIEVPALGLFGNINPDARIGHLPYSSAIWHPENCDGRRSPCWGTCPNPTCMSRIKVDEVIEELEKKFKTQGAARLGLMRSGETAQSAGNTEGGLTE